MELPHPLRIQRAPRIGIWQVCTCHGPDNAVSSACWPTRTCPLWYCREVFLSDFRRNFVYLPILKENFIHFTAHRPCVFSHTCTYFRIHTTLGSTCYVTGWLERWNQYKNNRNATIHHCFFELWSLSCFCRKQRRLFQSQKASLSISTRCVV